MKIPHEVRLIRSATDVIDNIPEPFATEWGDDEFGVFQSFSVGHNVQRMRWIPAGSFMMGSPENEAGRFDNETQHRVELTQDYWLSDTPVTQAMWEAVMGTKPSHFKGVTNPVETVSWRDCQGFLARLNKRIGGLNLRLPTEAEWEYACRSGMQTATWVGELDLDANWATAPQLDLIAWYHENAAGTTQPVALKSPNYWGLYDMLGNVYEWCADWQGPYDANLLRDPPGPQTGLDRVLRGGSWSSGARLVRAAYRTADLPDLRYNFVGFRLARSSVPGPASKRGAP